MNRNIACHRQGNGRPKPHIVFVSTFYLRLPQPEPRENWKLNHQHCSKQRPHSQARARGKLKTTISICGRHRFRVLEPPFEKSSALGGTEDHTAHQRTQSGLALRFMKRFNVSDSSQYSMAGNTEGVEVMVTVPAIGVVASCCDSICQRQCSPSSSSDCLKQQQNRNQQHHHFRQDMTKLSGEMGRVSGR